VRVGLQLLVGNSVPVVETLPVLAEEDSETVGWVPVCECVPEYDPVAEKVRVCPTVALAVALQLWLPLCDWDRVAVAVAVVVSGMDRLREPVGE